MAPDSFRHKVVQFAKDEMNSQFEEAARLDRDHKQAIEAHMRRAREADARRSKELTNVLKFAAVFLFLLFLYIIIFLKPRL